jgi:hypothetical protein
LPGRSGVDLDPLVASDALGVGRTGIPRASRAARLSVPALGRSEFDPFCELP